MQQFKSNQQKEKVYTSSVIVGVILSIMLRRLVVMRIFMKNIIVISAHPDDEILGAGGTLLKHKSKGDNLAWIIVTTMKEEQGFSKDKIAEGAKSISVTLKPLFANSIASYPRPHPIMHRLPIESLFANFLNIGVEPCRSHFASSAK